MMEDLRVDEEVLPQWSADEEDEALIKEALERRTSQQVEQSEPKQSGAKRSLTAQISHQIEGNETPKRRREASRIHAIFLTPRYSEQFEGKNIPLSTVRDAIANVLINDWSAGLDVITRGAEKTEISNVFRIGMEDEDTALRFRMYYSEKTKIDHNHTQGQEQGRDTDAIYLLLTATHTPKLGSARRQLR